MKTELRNEIADFIHQSMCVDGFVIFHHFDTITIKGNEITGAVFEVTDKTRGTFYIGWYKPKQSNNANT